jgi:hypothetical protein
MSVPSGEPTPASTPLPKKGRIDTDDGARRLARVIVSDIKIYNPGKTAGHSDLTSQIKDGRQLFKSRVAPDLAPIFDEILAASDLAARQHTAPPVAARSAPSRPALVPTPTPVAPRPAYQAPAEVEEESPSAEHDQEQNHRRPPMSSGVPELVKADEKTQPNPVDHDHGGDHTESLSTRPPSYQPPPPYDPPPVEAPLAPLASYDRPPTLASGIVDQLAMMPRSRLIAGAAAAVAAIGVLVYLLS